MLLPLFITTFTLLAAWLLLKLRYTRLQQYAKLPQLPPSLILGHLKALDGFIRAGKPNGHPDLACAKMSKALGNPPLIFADLRPFGPAMIVVRSHEVAEQIAKASKQFPYSLPKMLSVYRHMVHVTGATSILAAQALLPPPSFQTLQIALIRKE